MAKTKIEWADEVWNPVTGCTKVSQGCKYCYAETMAKRFWGERKFTDVQMHPERLEEPLRWRKPRRVFVNSMSDLFHENLEFRFIREVFWTMQQTPRHTYLILTKRPEVMLEWFTLNKDGPILPNVWLGVSCEDQATADERIPLLLRTPAVVRFVSCEPLLGAIYLSQYLKMPFDGRFGCSLDGSPSKRFIMPPGLNWVIVGGESGAQARPMHPDWARGIKNQCQEAGVSFFFKQWGEWAPEEYPEEALSKSDYRWQWVRGREECGYYCDEEHGHIDHNEWLMKRVGKKAAGRLLDGRVWNEYPMMEAAQ